MRASLSLSHCHKFPSGEQSEAKWMCLHVNRYKMSIYMITRRFHAYNTWAINLAIIPSVIRFNRTRQRHANVCLLCVRVRLYQFNFKFIRSAKCTIQREKTLYLSALEYTCASSEWCCNNTIKLIKPKWSESNRTEIVICHTIYNALWIYCEMKQWHTMGKITQHNFSLYRWKSSDLNRCTKIEGI